MSRSVIATCFIVPSSLNTTLSPPATVVEVALVSPSRTLISAVVAVTPSSMFNSDVFAVTPSRIFISLADEVTPLSLLSSAALALTNTPPSFKPFVPS